MTGALMGSVLVLWKTRAAAGVPGEEGVFEGVPAHGRRAVRGGAMRGASGRGGAERKPMEERAAASDRTMIVAFSSHFYMPLARASRHRTAAECNHGVGDCVACKEIAGRGAGSGGGAGEAGNCR